MKSKIIIVLVTIFIFLLILLADFAYTSSLRPKMICGEKYIWYISERQLNKAADFDIIFSKKQLQDNLGDMVTDGIFNIYGDF